MGLSAGYGVLLGTLLGYERDDPNDYGDFMHGTLTVRGESNTGQYRCPVDVDTQEGAIPIHWRIQPLRIEEWAPLLDLPDGWHPLTPDADSGAVDYIRDHRLRSFFFIPEPPTPVPWWDPFPPYERIFRLPHYRVLDRMRGVRLNRKHLSAHIREPIARNPGRDRLDPGNIASEPTTLRGLKGHYLSFAGPWNMGTSAQALTDLEAVLAGAERVLVFGEPFTYGGNGVHNIHQNQGDVIGGGHDDENAIWQDGVTIAIRADGTASAFLNKFGSQSDQTDDQGRPI